MRTLVERPIYTDDGTFLVYKEIAGESDETKPTAGILTGSIYFEADTGSYYTFSEKSGDWIFQFSLQD